MKNNHYFIPINNAESRLTDRGSRFIGYCTAASSEENAYAIIAGRNRLYSDATHNCWAMRVGNPTDPIERSSDAGEPAGTAGRPILDQLRKASLVGVVAIVTRWFGGTKLGRGGLIRAYSQCIDDAICLLTLKEKQPTLEFVITCSYDLIGLVEKLVSRYKGRVIGGDYKENVQLKVEVPVVDVKVFYERLRDESAGRIVIKDEG